jgi:excinuclease UvrABC nuclease subunit
VEQEMMTAAEELRFERAAELRDRLAVLRAELGEDALVAGAEG